MTFMASFFCDLIPSEMCIRIANDVVYPEAEKRRPGFQHWVSFAYGACRSDTINNKEKGTKEKQKTQIRIGVYGADLAYGPT